MPEGHEDGAFGGDAFLAGKFWGPGDQAGVISVARKGRFWYCSASEVSRKMGQALESGRF